MNSTRQKYDLVIIGASAAGVTSAITARRNYPDKSILVLTKDEKIPIPCGIPYIFGIVGDAEKNLIPIKDIFKKNNVDSLPKEAKKIDREKKVVIDQDGSEYTYDKLIVATGSNPIVPPINGIDKENIYSIKKDVDYLKELHEKIKKSKSICIVGCGFIGVELAEECRRKNKDKKIYIVEMMKHCLELVYDEDFCELSEKEMKDQNIDLLLNEKLLEFKGGEKVEKVALSSGKEIDVDLVILGIGASPNVELAKDASLEIGPTGSIQVNQYMQTNDKNIFSCGDCAEKVSFFSGKPSKYKLASIASGEARVAAANVFSLKRKNMGPIGVYSTSLGGKAFAGAGLTKKQALSEGYDVAIGEAEGINRHPGCMPGGDMMKVKLIFNSKNMEIIGGQIYGAESAGELINLVSACIMNKMTADQIATFQVATHPALTASPISYQVINAAEMAIKNRNL